MPTSDARILDAGTAYQTDVGMTGDYNSVIGMEKKGAISRFFSNSFNSLNFNVDHQTDAAT